ncbi:hypothetical protein F383_32363 [Gossypium arboreum]|uniref:Uncharacterized protein n=1 Tax=Gossypium arboreum TaxID=29729 RepID=A0A0B0PM03_GOSAR|nr:hypothetical protein F383_32363 [Gossypium arboreum]
MSNREIPHFSTFC